MNRNKSSYRDPSGWVFTYNNEIYRTINSIYKENYDFFISCGLYEELVSKEYIVPHVEIEQNKLDIVFNDNVYKVIKPKKIKFITYPYEWSFSQLKDAAILTLKILRIALKYDMILKDASSYNIQFHNGKPIFIDTLSFEKYSGENTWMGYNQFSKHFISPLLLMSYKDVRLNKLLISNIDGIDIDLTNNILSFKNKLNPFIFFNIKMQAKFQKKYENKDINADSKKEIGNKKKLINLNTYLQDNINKIKLNLKNTEWGEYYTFTNYNDISFQNKKNLVENFIDYIKPSSLWDFGANNGLFTRIASNKGIDSLAFDIDPLACEYNYNEIKKNNEKNILPVLFDFTNPSPSIGWANSERDSIKYRTKPDVIMALALIHHLAISNNVPLTYIAEYFSSLSKYLIIEFVPKEDSQVQKLLLTRKDIYHEYTIDHFEKYFTNYYKILKKENISNSKRTLYLMELI
ncbi:SAM-dependent methyltransferase [Brachyspira hyodysenteriae]|uniref:SAM-dependent methyltransferase n=1 Tax=Brachyspira hyodysenteriae TaxID=159 RepID=UPI001182BCDB|nr:SAM-dependent methyltransferase [Brachyspira hyodysenteriae]TVL42837.1 hypothetical protein A9X73_01935 [Brachyspira hyodysenteriae]